MNCDVLFVIDFSKRELAGCFLVKYFLEKLGLKARICSRFNLAQAFNINRPAAVIVPNTFLHLIDEIAPQTHVFLLPSESGSGMRKAIQLNFFGCSTRRPYSIDRIFCWGPKMAEWLKEDGIPEEKLLVTGSPTTDNLMIKRKPTYTEEKGDIGIATTFRLLNSSQGGKLNYFQCMYTTERSGGDGMYYEPPEHAESWVFFEACVARLLGDLIEELAVRQGLSISIRPHPMEPVMPYQFFANLSKGKVRAVKKGSISEWLESVSVLLTVMSTSGIDAVIQGVPVICLRNIINQDAYSRIPKQYHLDFEEFLWQADDMQKLKELCRDAQAGRLPVSPRQKDLNDFIYDHFFIPRPKLAAFLVAEEISKIMRKGRKRSSFSAIGTSQAGPSYRKILRKIYPNIDLIWFYLYGLSPENLDIGFTYLPWRVRAKKEAERSIARILEEIKNNKSEFFI